MGVLISVFFLTIVSGFSTNLGVELVFEDGSRTFMGDESYETVQETEENESYIQNWSYSNQSEYVNESQTKICLDLNECNYETNKSLGSQEYEEFIGELVTSKSYDENSRDTIVTPIIDEKISEASIDESSTIINNTQINDTSKNQNKISVPTTEEKIFFIKIWDLIKESWFEVFGKK